MFLKTSVVFTIDVQCNLACNSTTHSGHGEVSHCSSGTRCPYTCKGNYVANFRTLNCTEGGEWIPSMANPSTTTDFCACKLNSVLEGASLSNLKTQDVRTHIYWTNKVRDQRFIMCDFWNIAKCEQN